jgi:hypothetical protein
MKKRTLFLGLLLLASLCAEGCFCQPGPIRRWWNGGTCGRFYGPCCTSSCSSCCDAMADHYGPPVGSPVPGGPTMPNSTPLTRMQFGSR